MLNLRESGWWRMAVMFGVFYTVQVSGHRTFLETVRNFVFGHNM
ncbi:Uncharacterized protein AC496_5305 [Pseudomonas savastanoi pv. glycinea]|uniref:Uncharacterized protein n=2 Tax=Pseudomonas savastanoi pv. glycinea TaxID=318 RepID=A0ABR5L2F9_PSESG|nr:Uncharacterized protein AC498_1335 [Pseudomonas savastanoi pv. glycinea]KPC29060.1 Uncharacterized protein AC497_5216 [Pseudomonas savastanoi pv. glycinea]KPC38257.1 Uncharacterized protein AC496_5305 [Pseudomonas savastanoi pv. glycinea]